MYMFKNVKSLFFKNQDVKTFPNSISIRAMMSLIGVLVFALMVSHPAAAQQDNAQRLQDLKEATKIDADTTGWIHGGGIGMDIGQLAFVRSEERRVGKERRGR